MKKRIHLIATGGTIASQARSRVSTEGYKASVISVEDLLAELPELCEDMDVSSEQIFLKPSSAITESDLFLLSSRVNSLLTSDECDGVVITHGTDTMEETAFFLNLTVNSDKPVVITGAMRPAGVISSDGLLNLYNAFHVAASDKTRGMGVVIVMNDLILSAKDAVKYSTFKVEAYQAPLYGVLGTIRDGITDYAYKPVKRHTSTSLFAGKKFDLPQVDILYMVEGGDDNLFKAAIASQRKGIVCAGTGNGGVPFSIMNLYREENKENSNLPILVRSSRVPTGGVSESMQSLPRVIASHDLNPQKACILLRFCLAVTENPEDIREIFKEY